MLNTKIPTSDFDAANELDIGTIDSIALRRLVEEVRNAGGAGSAGATAYNRTYHRHNR